MPIEENVHILSLNLLRERERERLREITLLFHLFMHSLIASYMCPNWGLTL